MKKIWIVIGLSSSSFGNFSLSMLALSFSQSAKSFSDFAISFTFYTILISFFRPIVCDALINKDLHKDSNNREFLLDAFIISVVFALFSFLLYLIFPQLHSQAFFIIVISLPALLMQQRNSTLGYFLDIRISHPDFNSCFSGKQHINKFTFSVGNANFADYILRM